MRLQRIEKPLASFAQKVLEKITIQDLIVFGSYAYGKPRLDSDIDVLVVSNDFNNLDEDKRLDILYNAARVVEDKEIQPWALTPQELGQAEKHSLMAIARDKGIKVNLAGLI